ncbi:transglutaminase family protein [Agromyces soli]
MRADRAALSRLQALALSAASFLLVVVATMALGPLLEGSGWWWLCAAVAAAVLFGGAGIRALRAPASLVPVLEFVVLLATLTLFFGGTTGLLLVVPTPDTFAVFGTLLDGAARTIQQQAVPAVVVPPLAFALALGTGVIAVVVDFMVLTLRVPALAAAPALVPVLIPGFLIEDGAELGTLVLAAAAFLLLLRVDVRVRRRAELASGDPADDAVVVVPPSRVPIVSTLGVSLGLASVGLVLASLLTASTPSISTSLLLGTGGQGTLFARGVSPFLDLGRDLRRPDPVPAFRYTARDGDRPYFRLLTIDDFGGAVWGTGRTRLDGDNSVDELPAPAGLAADVARSEHPVDVVVEQLRTTWLPLPYPVASVEGLRGSWFWDRDTLTVRSADSDTEGQRYRATLVEIEPTVEQLRGARDPRLGLDAELAELTALPQGVPQAVVDRAEQIRAAADTPYDRAVAIQDFLRGPDFTYSTEAPVEAGYDGGGLDVIGEFLEKREGYCVHFASTMAVLARELGIPARISVGYTGGTPTSERIDNLSVVEVDSHDLHAWPELWFEGVGWVPFEPTPGRGTVPAYSRPDAGEQAVAPGRTPSTAPPAASGRPDLDPERDLAGGTGAAGAAGAASARIVGVAFAIVLLLLVPALWRIGQRAARRRRVRRGIRPADAAWREAMATVRDLGGGTADDQTPRAAAAALGAAPAFTGEAGVALQVLRDAVERERYGPPMADARSTPGGAEDPERLDRALAVVRTALLAGAAPLERLRAVLAPRSLLDRWRASRRRVEHA